LRCGRGRQFESWNGVQLCEMELEDLVVNFDVQPIRNRSTAVGGGSEPILRDDFDSVLVKFEGCLMLLYGNRIGD